MTLALSEAELYELTTKKRWSAQIRALNKMKIPCSVRPDGSPHVDREAYRLSQGAVRPRHAKSGTLNLDNLPINNRPPPRQKPELSVVHA